MQTSVGRALVLASSVDPFGGGKKALVFLGGASFHQAQEGGSNQDNSQAQVEHHQIQVEACIDVAVVAAAGQ